MFQVIYHNYEEERAREFDNLEDAMSYAEAKHYLGWYYVGVIGEYGNTVVEYEN